MLDLLKDTQNFTSSWFNVVPSLKKLRQAVVVRNEQVNLQPTLNKGAWDTSLTFLGLFVSKIKKKIEKGF